MAPKAAAAKAKAKAKAKYRPRGIGTRVAPPALQARNEQRRLAVRARAGFLRICPACAYPRYVPSAAHCRYACAMPSVQVANGDWARCDFRTTAQAWRRRPWASLAYESACKTIMPDVLRAVDARCEAGTLAWGAFWLTVQRELGDRIAAQLQPDPPAAAAQAPAQPPAAD